MKNHLAWLLGVGILLIAFTAVPVDGQQNGPQVSFTNASVTAKGVVPGGPVIFFSVGLDSDGYGAILRKTALVVNDDDRDGQVTLEVKPGVPFRSVWIVIDITNGQFSVAGPPGYRMRSAHGRRQLQKDAGGLLDQFVSDTGFIDAIYFHPGKGAWLGQVTDGEALDADDGQNGRTTLRLSDMKPLLSLGEKPKEFGPGGVLASIDFSTMQIFASRIDSMIGGR